MTIQEARTELGVINGRKNQLEAQLNEKVVGLLIVIAAQVFRVSPSKMLTRYRGIATVNAKCAVTAIGLYFVKNRRAMSALLKCNQSSIHYRVETFKNLMDTEETYRAKVNQCAELFTQESGIELKGL